MNADEPYARVSEISEMPVTFAVGHFLASLCWGTLAGTGSLIAVLLVASGLDFDFYNLGETIVILWLVSLVVGVFTLAGLVIIGLPLTLGLRKIEQETAATYASVGAIAGFLIMAIMFQAHKDALAFGFALIGAFAGGACAFRWGTWREARAAQRLSEAPAERRSNPIHDLTH